jgi:hypothetical protein
MKDSMKMKGEFKLQHWRNGQLLEERDITNGITNQGKNALLDIMFHNVTPVATWYIGLINNSGFTALAAADTYQSHAGWTELTGYDEAARPAWTEGDAASQSITNATSVDFTIDGTYAVNGIFIASEATKGANGSGPYLWSTASFASVLNVIDDDVIKVIYTLSVT